MKLKLDLHEIYNRGSDIDQALREIIDEAVRQEGHPGGDHPRQGIGSAEEAGPAVPRHQGDEGHLPPGGEGLRQLRTGVRPLPLEVTGTGSAPGHSRSVVTVFQFRVVASDPRRFSKKVLVSFVARSRSGRGDRPLAR